MAGVSVPYYTRIERGDMHGVSDSVLEALARALQLDEAERAYLFDLARALRPTGSPRPRRALRQRVRPSIQHVLDALTGAAAIVHNARLDNLTANQLGYALYSDMFSRVVGPAGGDSRRSTERDRMSGVATAIRPPSARVGGVAWLVFMVGMWIAFFVALLGDRLGDIWQWARDLPLVVEFGLWLLMFPWLLGGAVWENSWAPWLRISLVASFAVGWTLISIPRAKEPREGGARR